VVSSRALDERALDLATVDRRIERAPQSWTMVGGSTLYSPVRVSIATSLAAAP